MRVADVAFRRHWAVTSLNADAGMGEAVCSLTRDVLGATRPRIVVHTAQWPA